MIFTLDLPPGFNDDDTNFSKPCWRGGKNIRFVRGLPETIGGWEKLTEDTLGGVCRTAFYWNDDDNRDNLGFGCHNGLWVWQDGDLAEVTPVATAASGAITVATLPSLDQTFTVGSQVFTFKASRASAGQVTLGGSVNACATNIAAAINADVATVSAAAATNVVTVTADATGYAGNAIVFVTGTASGLTFSRSGTLLGGYTFSAGAIDGAGGSGYGTGAYGFGDFGEPSSEDFFALTWSMDTRSFGELYANPRGQGIFVWNNDTSEPAVGLDNAPKQCNFIIIPDTDQIMALGCTDTNGNFNQSCVRISDSRLPTRWAIGTDSNAQQFYLSGNARIVGARKVRDRVFIWTETELHEAFFNGTEWTFDSRGQGCGLAGPNAAEVLGGVAYWITPELQFYACALGGEPQLLPCPIREGFVQNAAKSQNDKIVAAALSERFEILWQYADARDGFECSRAIRFNATLPPENAWTRDEIPRTAYTNAVPSPVGVTFDGQIYWHERGSSADGQAFSWSLETSGLYMNNGERHAQIKKWRPDYVQEGAVNLNIYSRRYPQDDERVFGPYVASRGKKEVSVRASGMMLRAVFSGNSLPSSARFGKQTFEIVELGAR